MFDEQYDRVIKERLRAYQSAIPSDLWQRIGPEGDKGRRLYGVNRIIWFSILPIALLGCMGIIYILSYHRKEPLIKTIVPTVAQLDKLKVPEADQSEVSQRGPGGESQREPALSKEEGRITLPNEQKIKHARIERSSFPAQPFTDRSQKKRQESNTVENSDAGNLVFQTAGSFLLTKPISASPIDLSRFHKPVVLSKVGSQKKSAQNSSQNRPWSLDVYASPDWPINSLRGQDSNYRSIKQHMQLSYTLGIKVSKQLSQHFIYTIGIQYSMINFQSTINDSMFYPGPPIHYYSLDVPLWIGYTFTKRRFKGTVNTGIIANIYSGYHGDLQYASHFYKNWSGASVYLGFDMVEPLMDKTSVFMEPYFKYRLFNMVNTDQPFFEKIHTAGISIGIRYVLSKRPHN